jgi:transcriptional regulator
MYNPPHFEETRVDVLQQLMLQEPFAVVVTLGPSGLNANHLPLELDVSAPPFGTLRGHVSRANPMWKEPAAGVETLVIFEGPQHYVTPDWYPTKAETGKSVPTWNYVVVHAYGTPRFIEDPAWLRAHVERLTNRHESSRPVPWRVSDAPEDYVQWQLKGIVGFELPITRVSGKWKVSQNRNDADRRGVIAGLRGLAPGDADAAAIADQVERRL